MNPYESARLLSEYLLFHYGTPEEILPYEFGPHEGDGRLNIPGALGFAERCVSECFEFTAGAENLRALDLGCAVGRSSFELARHCSSVLGIDFSKAFVAAAGQLRECGELAYDRVDQGTLTTPLVARVPAKIDRARVQFETGDATDLRQDLGTFDLVLMANLLDRLPEPRACLARLPELVCSGGQVVITSPWTWLEEFTPREQWLGEFEESGQPVVSFATLRSILLEHFSIVQVKDLPFLIREHARKFQWSVAQATTWLRR